MSAVFQYRNTNFSFFRKTPLSMASIPLIGHRHFDTPLMCIRWCSLRRGACERDCRSDPYAKAAFLSCVIQTSHCCRAPVHVKRVRPCPTAPLGHRDSERHPLACCANDWPGDDDPSTALSPVGNRVNRI